MANGLARVGTYLMDYQGQKHLYEFATDGRLVLDKVATKGWIEANGKWYYYEVATDFQGLVRDSWKKINDAWYYFDSRGIMCTNELVYDAGMHCHYVVDANGCMAINQWVNVGNGNYPEWVYADANGIAYENKWLQIGNNWYYFEESIMVDVPTRIDGVLNLFNSSGVWLGTAQGKEGWIDAGYGSWFYLENNQLASGWKKINGEWYYFEGHWMVEDRTSWINGELHAFAKGGAWLGKVESDAAGWKNIGGKWYYFEDGYPVDGFRKIDGKVYGFDRNKYFMVTNDVLSIWNYDYDCQGELIGIYRNSLGFDANGNVAKNQWIYSESYEEWIWIDENGYGVPKNRSYGAS